MLDQDNAVKPAGAKEKGWSLYEEETPDGKTYKKGEGRNEQSAGKPTKNVVIASEGKVSAKMAIPRELFVTMAQKYLKSVRNSKDVGVEGWGIRDDRDGNVVVISTVVSAEMKIPKDAFVDMVKQYLKIKGYK